MNLSIFRSAMRAVGGALWVIALVAGEAAGVQANEAPLATKTSSTLAQKDMRLLGSDEPKTVTIDPASGKVLGVKRGQPFAIMAVKSNCTGDYACWNGRPPALNFGFNGTGASGTWGNRGSFQTKNYTALLCWSYGTPPYSTGYCMLEAEREGKNSTLEWGSAITGTKVSLRR